MTALRHIVTVLCVG